MYVATFSPAAHKALTAHPVLPCTCSMPMHSAAPMMMGPHGTNAPPMQPMQMPGQLPMPGPPHMPMGHMGVPPPPHGHMGGMRPPPPMPPSGMRRVQSALELCSWRNTSGDLDFWDPSGHLAEQLHSMQGIRVSAAAHHDLISADCCFCTLLVPYMLLPPCVVLF